MCDETKLDGLAKDRLFSTQKIDFCNSPVWNIQFDELNFYGLIQTWILQATSFRKIQFKLGKKSSSSNWTFQTGELQKSSADR